MICDEVEMWDGVRGEREAQEEGFTHTHTHTHTHTSS